jgi:hypothetical protein
VPPVPPPVPPRVPPPVPPPVSPSVPPHAPSTVECHASAAVLRKHRCAQAAGQGAVVAHGGSMWPAHAKEEMKEVRVWDPVAEEEAGSVGAQPRRSEGVGALETIQGS